MYIGDSMDAMPMPMPPMMRAAESCQGSIGTADPTEQATNNTAASSRTLLRPKRSASVPATAAPIRHPTSAEATIQPIIMSER